MSSEITLPCRVSFGLFEADIKSGELWKAGYRVKLQSQPFKVLTILLENAGEVVSREELQRRVWGPDVIVDFEHSLGGAIKKIREALGDSAENPRFVETLARRGFRFIAPVRSAEEPVRGIPKPSVSPVSTSSSPVKTELVSSALSPTVEESAGAKRTNVTYRTAAVCFGLGVLLMAAIAHFLDPRPTGVLPRISQITEDGLVYSPADPSIETLPASVTNGANIFTSYIQDGRVVLAQVSTSTGEFHILQLPNEIGVPEINDLSPDGSKLLVRSHLTSESIQPLWVVPVDGGSAFRVPNVLAQDATWMSDGKSILYASGDQLAVVSLETGQSVPFATVPGRAFWLRWSPDGKLVRFTLINPVDHTSSLWEISAGQHVARQILKNWSVPANECCGMWTSGGKYFVFQTTKDGLTDLWKLSGSSISGPLQVTNGPLSYEAPASARQGEQIFFVGHQSRSNLEQYDASRKEFVPRRDFLSDASRVSFSRDRQWVAWTGQAGHLWRAHADGTDKIRLTPESMFVFLAAWSPDGSRLALMAREPGAAWKIYIVRADGGGLECLTPQNRNVGDPSFSPDGSSIVFGQVTDLMGQETGHRSLEVLDLATKHTTDVPGSQGFFSPRWSPDGRYIAALSLDQQKVMLFDVANRTWSILAAASAADPVWSADSKALYIHAYMDRTEPIYRVSVPDGRMQEVANLRSFPAGTTGQYFFSGLAPDNVLLVTTEVSSNNLYTMDLDSK